MLAGMVQSTAAFDPVAHPQAATGRRNEVIDQMAQQGMITQQQAQEALASPLGVSNAAPARQRLHRRGRRRVLLQVRRRLPRRGRPARRAAQPRRLHDPHHARPHRAHRDDGRPARRGPGPGAQRRRRHGRGRARPGPPEVTAMGANRVFGVDGEAAGDQLRPALGAGEPRRRLGLQGVHRGHRAARRAWASTTRCRSRPTATRRRSTATAQGNPFPVRNAGRPTPRVLSMTDALAQSPNTGVRQAHGVHRRRAGGRHGGEARDALAGRAAGADGGTVDRRDREGAEPGLVHPRRHARRARSSSPTSAPPSPRAASGARRPRSSRDHRPDGAPGPGLRAALRAGRRARAGRHADERDEQGRPARRHRGRARRARRLDPADVAARPGPRSRTSRPRSSGSPPASRARSSRSTTRRPRARSATAAATPAVPLLAAATSSAARRRRGPGTRR